MSESFLVLFKEVNLKDNLNENKWIVNFDLKIKGLGPFLWSLLLLLVVISDGVSAKGTSTDTKMSSYWAWPDVS